MQNIYLNISSYFLVVLEPYYLLKDFVLGKSRASFRGRTSCSSTLNWLLWTQVQRTALQVGAKGQVQLKFEFFFYCWKTNWRLYHCVDNYIVSIKYHGQYILHLCGISYTSKNMLSNSFLLLTKEKLNNFLEINDF